MSAAFVPSWPGSRVLLGWWRELAGRKPQHMRLSRLWVHRLEALVHVRRSQPLDPWQRGLLNLANTRLPCQGELINFFKDLQMDQQILCRLICELTERGLLHRNGTGMWQMTPAGRQALQTGGVSTVVEERRTFTFVDNSALGRPPHFLPLHAEQRAGSVSDRGEYPRAGSVSDSGEYPIDATALQACIEQTPTWKKRFRFPTEVEALLLPKPEETPAANWRRVLLDTVEQQLLVFIQTTPPTMQASRGLTAAPLLGFVVSSESWTLEPKPMLVLEEGWEEALPDLADEPSPLMWRQAWQSWAQPRNLPLAEVQACRLERLDHRLLVYAPPRLIDRLRAARSDAIKHEAWLLAGQGRTRTAAQIELHPL